MITKKLVDHLKTSQDPELLALASILASTQKDIASIDKPRDKGDENVFDDEIKDTVSAFVKTDQDFYITDPEDNSLSTNCWLEWRGESKSDCLKQAKAYLFDKSNYQITEERFEYFKSEWLEPVFKMLEMDELDEGLMGGNWEFELYFDSIEKQKREDSLEAVIAKIKKIASEDDVISENVNTGVALWCDSGIISK